MSAIQEYHNRISQIMAEAFDKEAVNMEKVASILADASMKNRSIFAFGCNHAGLITLELFYRTGGLVTVNPIRVPGMMLEVSPITMSSQIERLEQYGRVILDSIPARKGDILLIHSVSGRNAVTIDMAEAAKEKGLTVIVLTNLCTAAAVSSRHISGKKLHDFADVLIDNHGDYGDAAIQLTGFPQKVAPSSTVIGAAILNAVVARTCEILLERGYMPPVFMSGNIDGGDTYNQKVIAEHAKNIFYM